MSRIEGVASVIEAVAKSSGDLGLVRVEADAGPWWRRLPKTRARRKSSRGCPSSSGPIIPAGMPLFVIAQPLAEAAVRDVCLYAVSLDGWRGAAPSRLDAIAADFIAAAPDSGKTSLLVAVDGALTPQQLREALAAAGAIAPRIAEVGGHAARFEASEAQRRAPVEAAH